MKIKKPLISIILPTYNRVHSIQKIILPSLEKQSFLNYELIVIDDGSTDGTEEYFKSKDFKRNFPKISRKIVYIKNLKNLGLPKSRNLGVSVSKGKWIQMVEDDLELLKKDFLKKIEEIIRISKNNQIYIPRLLCKKNVYKKPKGNYVAYEDKITKDIYANFSIKKKQKIICGHSCAIIPKNIFNIQKYDEKNYIGNYFREEGDFYIMARKNNYEINFIPEPTLMHHNNNSGGCKSTKNIVRLEYYHLFNHYKYLKKHFNLAMIRFIIFTLKREKNNLINIIKLKIKNE